MRNSQIDFLRFIGLSLIILAHVNPPSSIFQLRNFDVPLMVIVSGMAFVQKDFKEFYLSYLWRRVQRLLVPVWLFFTLYFLFIFVTKIRLENLTVRNIVETYALMDGIGFVWIIRIFLIVALVAPWIFRFSQRIESNKLYLTNLVILYFCYAVFLNNFFGFFTAGIIAKFVNFYLYYGIAYGLIFALGLRLNKLTFAESVFVGISCFIIFIILGYSYYLHYHHIISTRHYKFPPRTYYLSYAIGMGIFAKLVVDRLSFVTSTTSIGMRLILFIACNTLWIYLWHIPFIRITSHMAPQLFFLRFFVVYLAAVVVVFSQVFVLNRFVLPKLSNQILREKIKYIMTG